MKAANPNLAFAAWIESNLALRGWTQTDLAREAGLSRQAISYYMSDKSKYPTLEGISAICKAFNLPIQAALIALGVLPAEEKKKTISRAAAALLDEMEPDESPQYQRALEDLDRRRERLTDALEDGTLDPSTYRSRMSSLDERIAVVRAQLEHEQDRASRRDERDRTLSVLADTLDRLQGFIYLWPPQEVNAALRKVIQKVMVGRSTLTIQVID